MKKQRRLEGKTDYKARIALLKSGKPRLVARKTNRYIIAQIVETKAAQDKVTLSFNSKTLLSKGWPKDKEGSLKSLQAAYLTGFMLGKLAHEKNIESTIFDIGINRNVRKSRLYAILKGALDAGLDIPHNPEALPSLSDLQKNEKLKNLIERMKQK